jgi:hypothetical protein
LPARLEDRPRGGHIGGDTLASLCFTDNDCVLQGSGSSRDLDNKLCE